MDKKLANVFQDLLIAAKVSKADAGISYRDLKLLPFLDTAGEEREKPRRGRDSISSSTAASSSFSRLESVRILLDD